MNGWKVNENAEANQWYITDADGKWVIGLILNGEMSPKRQKAVLDRVAACVNACEGINPEAVPELLATLKDVLRIAKAASIGVTGNAARIQRAEAAIAAVQP